jgi:hypothetical protein
MALAVAVIGLGIHARPVHAAVVHITPPAPINIPASGLNLNVVTQKYDPSVANPSITVISGSSLQLRDNGTIPSGNSGVGGGGAYVGIGNTFPNLTEGRAIRTATGNDEETYCDTFALAHVDTKTGWNFNSDKNLVGFRFVYNGELHYGWVRIRLGADETSASIVEYAYNDQPDSFGQNAWVYAGETYSTWDFDPSTGLPAYVAPMQHDMRLSGFMPLLTQSLPIPTLDWQSPNAESLRGSGALAQEIDTLWKRGIAPYVYTGGVGDDSSALATALTLKEAQIPIHVFSALSDTDFWPTTAVPYPWFTLPDGTSTEPVFPLAITTVAYNKLKARYQYLLDNDVDLAVAGVWMDYESWPRARSAEQRAGGATQYYTDAYAAGNGVLISHYPSTLLTDDSRNGPMFKYSADLFYALLKQSAYKAVTDVFGTGPTFANSDSFFTGATAPPYPDGSAIYVPETGILANPNIYAGTVYLSGDFQNDNPGNYPLNQTTADNDYWYTMLTKASNCAKNKGAIGRTIPFVSYFSADVSLQPYADWAMSSTAYKELLRHVWLRGASGMLVFNPGPPFASPQKSFTELEYARGVLDEILSFRSFITNGKPINFNVNSQMFVGGVEWSGMSDSATNPTKWVVRTVSRTGSAGLVPTITPAPDLLPGLTFNNIPAPPDGATFILNMDGTQHRVDSRPSSVYLQFETGFQNSPPGNGLDGVPGYYPSGSYDGGNDQEGTGINPNPLLLPNVPQTPSGVQSMLNGYYGLYANQHNSQSLALMSFGAPNSGNYVAVPNTNDVFNAPSFTVEAFVNLNGYQPDHASILSKGLGSAQFDWTLEMPSYSSRLLELDLTLDDGTASGTHYSLVTASAPPTSGWHHVALTYDSSTDMNHPTVTLYVDYLKQPWGQSTGVLPMPMKQRSGDNLVIGYFEPRGVNGSFDEVRYTPEALDPLQMLTNAALQ